MANTGLAFLGSLRQQARQRSDMVNSGFCTDVEFNAYIATSYKELYDLLVASYGDNYYVASPYRFQTTANTYQYALPDGLTTTDSVSSLVAVPLYKLIGVDLQVTSSPDSWVTLKRAEFIDRNRYNPVTPYTVRGFLGYYYQVVGSNLWLTPVPQSSQTIQVWYVPKPTNLQAEVSCTVTGSSATVTTSDTSQLAVGMNVADLIVSQNTTGIIPSGTTISSIVANTSFTMSQTATGSGSNYLLACWADNTTLDGISGWEQYIVIDAAMKALIKEESDIQPLLVEKEAMRQRIMEIAAGRDAGLPARVSDVRNSDFGWGDSGWPGGGWETW